MNGGYLPPRIIQGVGIALLVAMLVFWGVTGKQSEVFVGAASGMILLGVAGETKRFLSKTEPPPDEPAKGTGD